MQRTFYWRIIIAVAAMAFLFSAEGCKKKKPVPQTPLTTTDSKDTQTGTGDSTEALPPYITLTADPMLIAMGETTKLSWESRYTSQHRRGGEG